MMIEEVAKSSSQRAKNKTVEQTYTKKTQLEHILLRPDTYIGSIEKQTQAMWVLDSATKRIVTKQCTFVPGLFKIFDEIMVNAADNKQRDPSMSRIEVTINPEENCIRVWNNGAGIPVVVHQEHGIYVPELIFGHLLTGSNFDDDEQKTTGGRNGYGAKLANIFSTRFVVETADKSRGVKFRQEFTNNMSDKGEPVISKFSGPEFTCITFYPDLRRFKMDSLDEDIVALLSKRVYDIAGTNCSTGAKLNVLLNGEKLEVRGFESYLTLYDGLEPPVTFGRVNEHWEIGVGVSDGAFQQVSFVNSICTSKGGCHVNYIADQITAKLAVVIKKKNKGEEVKAHQIKNHLAIYVNCLIVNPAFDSQTKENLTTKASAFGSTCVLPDKMLKQIEKSNIIDNILNWAKFKQTAELKKKSGSKKSKLFGISKLDDANFAGTAKSSRCTLILTEGDSAKALAISGLGVVGRDYYGVFPLKGKLLNVREASHQQIMKNEEIQNISKILGLTFGKTYEDVSSLRYGHLMIMTDQDHDGSHIKGLLINFLHHFWPSLLRIDGFLQQFITPIVKCSRGKSELSFYTIPEYQQWREANDEGKGWKIKYYKGLGTSTAAEAKEYFGNLNTHQINFGWDANADDAIDMAFAKKRVDDRKLWLLAMEPGTHIDYNVQKICYDTFVNRELILFSHADNQRSIPHFMDGMKPSQRKVLFACFKRNLKSEIKVAQLAGYVSEHSAYHHGEASLTQTIVGMAQNFVGSNNINLLSPCGQFGTRLMGGKDAASPRYVFTKLESITRSIFHPDDDALLEYLDEDGQSIEPLYYAPIIPMVLVNGSEGIGTGWSSTVPTYNPREIIENLRLMIRGEQPQEMMPWFRGFTGTVEGKVGKDTSTFIISGAVEKVSEDTVVISELPVGRWTTDYKQFLESVLIGGPGAAAAQREKDGEAAPVAAPTSGPFVKDFKENHTDTTVLFTVSCPPAKLADLDQADLVKKFKAETTISTTNMHLFDLNSQIRKFDGPVSVMQEFFKVRLVYYDRRKAHMVKVMSEEWEKLDNKMRFVLAVIKNEIIVSNRKKAELLSDIKNRGFKPFYDRKGASIENGEASDVSDGSSAVAANAIPLEKGYDYLLGMKIWSLTMERVNELIAERNAMRVKLDELIGKTSEMLWLEDLDKLEMALSDFEAAIAEENKQEIAARKKAGFKIASSEIRRPPPPRAVPALSMPTAAIGSGSGSITDYFPSAGLSSGVPSALVEATAALSIAPKKRVPTASVKPKASGAARKKAVVDLDSGDEDEQSEDMVIDLVDPPVAPMQRAKRAAAAKPLLYAIADERNGSDVDDLVDSVEDDDDDVDEDSFSDASDSFIASEDDDFSAMEQRKPSKAKKSATASKPPSLIAGVSTAGAGKKATSAVLVSTAAVSSVLPKGAAAAKKPALAMASATQIVVPATPPAKAGSKRANKNSNKFTEDGMEPFSPGMDSPAVVKKAKKAPVAKKATAAGSVSVAVAAPVAKKTTAAEKKPAAKAPTAAKGKKTTKKKSMFGSDDEEEDAEEVTVQPIAYSKPQRQRKTTNYANYYEDDEDVLEDSSDDFDASDSD